MKIDWDQLYPFFLIFLYLVYFFLSARKKTRKPPTPKRKTEPEPIILKPELNQKLRVNRTSKRKSILVPQKKKEEIERNENTVHRLVKKKRGLRLKEAMVAKSILEKVNF